ncbi:MAG: tyrosine-type recombinase/integrase [Acidimicrobiales bacterium]
MNETNFQKIDLGPDFERWVERRSGEGKSEATKRAYIQGLRRTAKLLSPNGGFNPWEVGDDKAVLTEKSIDSLMSWMTANKLKPQTMSTTLTALKHFLDWTAAEVEETLRREDPQRIYEGKMFEWPIKWEQVRKTYKKALSAPERAPSHLRDTEVIDLFAAAGRYPQKGDKGERVRWPVRDQALIMLLMWGGLRVAEVCSLKVSSVLRKDENGQRMLRIIGKGKKMRLLPLSPTAEDFLDRYLEKREDIPEVDLKKDPLLVDINGKGLTANKVTYLMQLLYKDAKVSAPEGALVHGLRHTAAIQLIGEGVSANEVQNWLGHSSLETTGRYTKVVAVELAKAAKKSGMNKVMKNAPMSEEKQ